MINIEIFKKLTVSGVFALINNEDKRVYIGTSRCISASLSSIFRKIRGNEFRYEDMVDDVDKLEAIVLEEDVTDVRLSKVKAQYWCTHYVDLGYSLYRTVPLIRYRVVSEVEDVSNGSKSILYRVMVRLVNTRYESEVVGVFEDVYSAKSFMDQYYPNGVVKGIFVSDNDLTTKYRNTL